MPGTKKWQMDEILFVQDLFHIYKMNHEEIIPVFNQEFPQAKQGKTVQSIKHCLKEYTTEEYNQYWAENEVAYIFGRRAAGLRLDQIATDVRTNFPQHMWPEYLNGKTFKPERCIEYVLAKWRNDPQFTAVTPDQREIDVLVPRLQQGQAVEEVVRNLAATETPWEVPTWFVWWVKGRYIAIPQAIEQAAAARRGQLARQNLPNNGRSAIPEGIIIRPAVPPQLQNRPHLLYHERRPHWTSELNFGRPPQRTRLVGAGSSNQTHAQPPYSQRSSRGDVEATSVQQEIGGRADGQDQNRNLGLAEVADGQYLPQEQWNMGHAQDQVKMLPPNLMHQNQQSALQYGHQPGEPMNGMLGHDYPLIYSPRRPQHLGMSSSRTPNFSWQQSDGMGGQTHRIQSPEYHNWLSPWQNRNGSASQKLMVTREPQGQQSQWLQGDGTRFRQPHPDALGRQYQYPTPPEPGAIVIGENVTSDDMGLELENYLHLDRLQPHQNQRHPQTPQPHQIQSHIFSPRVEQHDQVPVFHEAMAQNQETFLSNVDPDSEIDLSIDPSLFLPQPSFLYSSEPHIFHAGSPQSFITRYAPLEMAQEQATPSPSNHNQADHIPENIALRLEQPPFQLTPAQNHILPQRTPEMSVDYDQDALELSWDARVAPHLNFGSEQHREHMVQGSYIENSSESLRVLVSEPVFRSYDDEGVDFPALRISPDPPDKTSEGRFDSERETAIEIAQEDAESGKMGSDDDLEFFFGESAQGLDCHILSSPNRILASPRTFKNDEIRTIEVGDGEDAEWEPDDEINSSVQKSGSRAMAHNQDGEERRRKHLETCKNLAQWAS